MAQFSFSCALPLLPTLFFFRKGKDLHDAVCQGGRGLLTMLTVLSCSSREYTWVIISCTCGIGVSAFCGLQMILSVSVGFEGDSPHPTQIPSTPGTRCCAQETSPLWGSCFPPVPTQACPVLPPSPVAQRGSKCWIHSPVFTVVFPD